MVESPQADTPYHINADLLLSGVRIVVGHTDDSVVIDTLGEATYMEIAEAELLIAAIRAAIGQVGT